MKHGTTPTLAVKLALTPEELKSLSFAFRSSECEAISNLFEKCWPEDPCVSYDEEQERWLISLTSEETWMFSTGRNIFMDVRPVLLNGCVPDTAILKLGPATPSFFPESKEDGTLVTGDPENTVAVSLGNICYLGGGGYYTPAVDSDGNLTWTASQEGMPEVAVANIKGPKGDTGATGANGADGKSPVRGEDYWTEADKTEIVNSVLASLPDGDEVSY